MKRILLSAAAALALTAAAGAFAMAYAADAAPAAAATPAADPTVAPRMGPWGFDLSGMDRKVAPGDNFVRYATGTYLDTLTIPSDRTSWGSFNALAELSNARTQAIIDRASATKGATGEAQQIGALYNSFMDEARLDALGAKPLAADFSRIKGATTREAQAELMGRTQGAFGGSFFGSYIWQDAKAPTRYAAYVSQSGLGLPDRDYYLDAKFAEKKTAYRAHVAKILTLAGWPDAEKAADAIVALETRIAEASWTKVEQRDADKTYNPRTIAELEKMAPGFPWAAWAKGAGLSKGKLIVGEPTAFTKIAAIYGETPVPVLQAWQAFHTADQASQYLSKAFADANFEFYGKTLSGQPQQRARAKRGSGLVGNNLGEAVGKLYVAAYFPAESKAKAEKLVNDLLVAMKGRIDNLDWMSPETKAAAQKKLSTFTVKIGYPDKWRDYSALTIKADDLYGNIERVNAFNWAYETAKLDKPVDRAEWGMFPQTVNAYYNPTLNEIVFPAAILQPPFFDPDADDGHQLRRHRRGDRPRDQPRLRRPGRQVRRRRRPARLVAAGRHGPVPGSHQAARRHVLGLRAAAGHLRQRRPDHGREHRRPGRHPDCARRLPSVARRQAGAGDRRLHGRPALLPGLRPDLAGQVPRRRDQAAGRLRPALAGLLPRLWHGAERRRLVRRLRRQGRPGHVREALGPRPHLVSGYATSLL